MSKRSFDIDWMVRQLRAVVRPLRKAALFELADDGFDSPFEQLIACILSIRTRDETTVPCARRLFSLARTPSGMVKLSSDRIETAIAKSTFHDPKARQIRAIAARIEKEFSGALPCEFEVLTSFAGVGPKCANLVLGIACGKPSIGVDVHVHRVTNRWGYIQEKTPERTMRALEGKLPEEYWVEINRLLVPFGKHICTGKLPHCSTCPVLEMCRQVGVEKHR